MKIKYNALLKRNAKAEEFINNSTQEEFDKWYPEFNKIARELSEIMNMYPNMTKDEILNGFREV